MPKSAVGLDSPSAILPGAATEETLDLLARIRLFSHLPPDHLQRIASLLEPRTVKAGKRIFSEGDPGDCLYIIVSGTVRVFVTSSAGDEMTLTTLGQTDVFGELALLDGETRSATAEARDKVSLLTLRRDAFLSVLATVPGLTEGVLAALATMVRRLTDQTADVVFHDVHERVARLLLRLVEESAVGDEEVSLKRRETEDEIATIIGRSPQSVSDILHSFEHLGCLGIDGPTIFVRDVAKLRRQVREGLSWAELTEKVYHDPLTKVANRVLFNERLTSALANAMRSGRPVAVLYLDLDGFKTINDSFGHSSGDTVLQEVAERLGGCVRKPDTIARLGGDEFGVLLEDLHSGEAAITVANRIITAVREPLTRLQGRGTVGASIGVSIFGDGNRVLAEDLLKQADGAMYAAKMSGKGRHVLYTPSTPVAPRDAPDGRGR